MLVTFAFAAAFTAVVLSWFASAQPDGLEWSIKRAAGGAELAVPDDGVHRILAQAQKAIALLPDYALPSAVPAADSATATRPAWPKVDGGTSLAGVVGGIVTLVLVWTLGVLLKRRRR